MKNIVNKKKEKKKETRNNFINPKRRFKREKLFYKRMHNNTSIQRNNRKTIKEQNCNIVSMK